jgi:hypothetical protein
VKQCFLSFFGPSGDHASGVVAAVAVAAATAVAVAAVVAVVGDAVAVNKNEGSA